MFFRASCTLGAEYLSLFTPNALHVTRITLCSHVHADIVLKVIGLVLPLAKRRNRRCPRLCAKRLLMTFRDERRPPSR